MADEVLIPLSTAAERVPLATEVRSTLLVASQQTLRRHGLFERYFALVEPSHRETLGSLIAGAWHPIAVGTAHYDACDAMQLPNDVLMSIGCDLQRSLQASILLHLMHAARSVGVTPETILVQTPKFWGRTFRGSEIGLYRAGPKELRYVLAGFPFSRAMYNRVTFRGILASLLGPFCNRVYVSESREAWGSTTIGWRISWA